MMTHEEVIRKSFLQKEFPVPVALVMYTKKVWSWRYWRWRQLQFLAELKLASIRVSEYDDAFTYTFHPYHVTDAGQYHSIMLRFDNAVPYTANFAEGPVNSLRGDVLNLSNTFNVV